MDSISSGGRGRVCFFAPRLYPAAVPGADDYVGGAEVQQWALARGLADRGFDVGVATADYGQEATVDQDGVSLLRAYDPGAGVPGVRLLYPRLWQTMRTLGRSRAEVYLAQGAGLWAGWTYDAARLHGSRFVFLAASDTDAMESLPWLGKAREKWWYLRALRGAHARIAQTEHQRTLFRQSFGVDTEVIGNPIDHPAAVADPGANDLVLWISTLKRIKRPEWFTELARRLPQLNFAMVGPVPVFGEGQEAREAAQAVAADTANLEVRGFVEHDAITELMRKAALFVHTSPLEGFPMVFLEAWSHGVPTVTCVDPDEAVSRGGMGVVVHEFDQLVAAVSTLMADPSLRREMGARARQYIATHHSGEDTYGRLAAVLDRLVAEKRRR